MLVGELRCIQENEKEELLVLDSVMTLLPKITSAPYFLFQPPPLLLSLFCFLLIFPGSVSITNRQFSLFLLLIGEFDSILERELIGIVQQFLDKLFFLSFGSRACYAAREQR
jgi:hypothetical protein